jgi:transposase-like protein
VTVAGVWRYVYRAVDHFGQVIDVYLSRRRDLTTARRFFALALRDHGRPTEVVTDKAPSLIRVVDELLPEACLSTERFADNRVERDHARLKARLRPLRGLQSDRTAVVVMQGHAFVQNLRRGHDELGVNTRHDGFRLAAAFDELAPAV